MEFPFFYDQYIEYSTSSSSPSSPPQFSWPHPHYLLGNMLAPCSLHAGWQRHRCGVMLAPVQGDNDTGAWWRQHPCGMTTAPVRGDDGPGAGWWRHRCGVTTAQVRGDYGTGVGWRRHLCKVTNVSKRKKMKNKTILEWSEGPHRWAGKDVQVPVGRQFV